MASFKDDLVEYLPSLRAFARALCSNQALVDDLVQETLLRAWANQESFIAGTNLRAWLFTILRNFFYNEGRKRRRIVEMEDGAFDIGTDETQLTKMHLMDLERELSKLAPERREALILVSMDGFSYQEVAQICNCAVGTVKSRVSRARKELEAKLGGPEVGKVVSLPNGRPRWAGGQSS